MRRRKEFECSKSTLIFTYVKKHWKTLGSRLIYENSWIRLREDQVEQPGRPARPFSVVEFKGGVGIVALDSRGRCVLVGQFRYPLGRFSWEIPKGAFPSFDQKNRNPLETAKRELVEETGLSAARWDSLALVHTLLGSTDDEVSLFCARELTAGTPEFEVVEDISVKWVTIPAFWDMVASQEVTDATSIAAIGLCVQRGLSP
ncbi:MAG: NUDIX hydrolase [bacterium]